MYYFEIIIETSHCIDIFKYITKDYEFENSHDQVSKLPRRL